LTCNGFEISGLVMPILSSLDLLDDSNAMEFGALFQGHNCQSQDFIGKYAFLSPIQYVLPPKSPLVMFLFYQRAKYDIFCDSSKSSSVTIKTKPFLQKPR